MNKQMMKDILDMHKVDAESLRVLNELTVKFDNGGDIESITLNDESVFNRLRPSDFLPLHTFIESLRVDEKEYTE